VREQAEHLADVVAQIIFTELRINMQVVVLEVFIQTQQAHGRRFQVFMAVALEPLQAAE
jgi:hypothetical protein